MLQTRLLFLSVSIAVVAVAGALQAPPQTDQQRDSAPTFRARTRLVEVDAVVHGHGGPVKGLTQDDFTLLDNGKPQKISVFSVKGAQNPGQLAAVPLAPGTVSNRLNRNGQTPVTSTIILFDRLNTSPEDQFYAKRKIVKYLETRRSQDRLAIYTLAGGLHVIQDLTDDPERLSRAVSSLKPQSAKTRTLDVPGEFEEREAEMDGPALEEYKSFTAAEPPLVVKHALQAIAQHLAPVPGRKNLIWITGGFPLMIKTEHETRYFIQEMKEATQALNDANVALYPVDARGLVYGGMFKRGGLMVGNLDTMNYVAGQTGGKAYYADNGIDNLIQEAVDDSEVIYTLGFYPSQESQDGDWHKLKVSVAKRGVTVRSREAYFASKVSADNGRHQTVDELLRNTLDAAEIGVLAEATPDREHPGAYRVLTTADLHDVQLVRQGRLWTGAVNIAFYIEGEKILHRISRTIEVPEEQLVSALEKGIVVDLSIGLQAPIGTLRVVVQDNATGASGSLRVPLRR